MPAAMIVWLDSPARQVAARRFYEAALKLDLSPEQAVALTSSVFRSKAAPNVPAFAARWRRAGRDRPHGHGRAA